MGHMDAMDMRNFRTPGQYIEALISSRGWTQRVLAIIIGIDETMLNKIISGKKSIDAKTSLLLGDLFEVDPSDFLGLQKEYDLAKAKIEMQPDPGRSTRAHLFGGLPISDMIKRGWLSATNVRDVAQVEAALVKFFEAKSVDDIEILPHAAKKTQTFAPATPAQIAWIYRVKTIAKEMLVGKFSINSAKSAVDKLKSLLHSPEETRKVPRILAESGIRYLIVEALPSSKIDGVCFWLDDKSPVIAMTLRYDRIDNFWFVLRHELEHVIQKHGQQVVMVDSDLCGGKEEVDLDVSEEERLANEAAIEFCVPQKKMESFIARKYPFFKESDILGFANTLHIHPGIIAGQLQHRTGRYDRFRGHLVKIRRAVSPGAMVDGWGDIAPTD
jgi:HTH-type transcriptional regulator/antitoxin HigA